MFVCLFVFFCFMSARDLYIFIKPLTSVSYCSCFCLLPVVYYTPDQEFFFFLRSTEFVFQLGPYLLSLSICIFIYQSLSNRFATGSCIRLGVFVLLFYFCINSLFFNICLYALHFQLKTRRLNQLM